MNKLNILYLEDSEQDAEMTARVLKKAGIPFQFKLVDKQDEYEAALNECIPDLVLADHSLFQFNSFEALKIFKSHNCRVPFILVTGAVSEEFAVNILKEGADDYLLKDNLVRLPNAILNALEKRKMENELQAHLEQVIANEALLKEAEHLAKIGSWQYDLRTQEIKCSAEVFRIYGYEPGEIEANYENLLKHIHPDDIESLTSKVKKVIQARNEYESEFRIIDKKGKTKHLSFKIVINRDENQNPERLVGFNHDITDRKEAEIKLVHSFKEVNKLEKRLANQHLRQQKLITEVTIQAQEKERDELAKELHDNINQILATVKIFLNVAKEDEKMRAALVEKSYNNVNQAIEEIRKLSQSLICPTLGDIGLIDALTELSNQINVVSGMKVEVSHEVTRKKALETKLELMLYRIVQEQLNNIVKYAKATKVNIFLRIDSKEVYLSIKDNGVGFDTTKKAKGIGLKNIRSRVEFYSGKLNIVSGPEQGCLMEITIPV